MNIQFRRTKVRAFVAQLVLVLFVGTGCSRSTAPTLSYNESNRKELRKLLEKKAAAETATASSAEPTGWGTLAGKFTLIGAAPQRVPLKVDKDLNICAPSGMQTLDESVVIGPDNGIKNVLLYLGTSVPADNPKWIHESHANSASEDVIFDQKNCVFLTHVTALWAKQKVQVLNSDPTGHNTNIDSKRGAAAGNFTVPANASAYYEPGKPSPAPFGVSCSIHPWMKAWMMVCESPYFAVTADDGSFEIKNLPAGVPLEFRVWQEKAGFLQAVTIDGQAQKWNKGRFALTLANDETKQLGVAIDAGIFQ
jgi:hypothetical protein